MPTWYFITFNMITPKLEELIWCGKAVFKTFVAGGTGKHILNIEQDKYIIITDITYFSQLHVPKVDLAELTLMLTKGLNTQVTILGNRGFNRFVFRNNFNTAKADLGAGVTDIHVPFGNCKIDTYLLHTDSVSFSFSDGINFNTSSTGVAADNVPAYPQPLDYGKQGGANQPSIFRMNYLDPLPLTWVFDAQRLQIDPALAGNYITQELSYPITPTTSNNTIVNRNQWAQPLLHVNYVEIKGQPNNIDSK